MGGDPGIGKSTILLQAAAALANQGLNIVYISGEEAIAQVRLRAARLGVNMSPVQLASETHVETILATLEAAGKPDLVIIDSIQTLWTERVDSAPGTVTQVRTSAQAMTRFAKKSGAAVVLVGHVTKDGQIAGPRVVEHMVDAVLYFEGDASHNFRILRGVKTATAQLTKSACLRWRLKACVKWPTRPRYSSINGTRMHPAQRFLPAWKAQGQFWSRSKRWFPLRRWAHRVAPLWVGIHHVSQWYWLFLKHIAACALAPTTFISTLRVA